MSFPERSIKPEDKTQFGECFVSIEEGIHRNKDIKTLPKLLSFCAKAYEKEVVECLVSKLKSYLPRIHEDFDAIEESCKPLFKKYPENPMVSTLYNTFKRTKDNLEYDIMEKEIRIKQQYPDVLTINQIARINDKYNVFYDKKKAKEKNRKFKKELQYGFQPSFDFSLVEERYARELEYNYPDVEKELDTYLDKKETWERIDEQCHEQEENLKELEYDYEDGIAEITEAYQRLREEFDGERHEFIDDFKLIEDRQALDDWYKRKAKQIVANWIPDYVCTEAEYQLIDFEARERFEEKRLWDEYLGQEWHKQKEDKKYFA